ncbi:TetR/AcrR family transcriptional regulator [Streptomyces sp. B-S-A8]|uniref:TetR/AcrR family transcriptional regulator n=1 Tax=Streptomyces solicavernae TaxID=3043614 RepID=A0ABT6RWH8_9ACTN|nr:TetR/AcrR family transcriptional regulator [Streptomyces sp. B-S-A8]MDI3388801.1 TetR/AcrR family transcriptional regulator [Streptomyces sp. B-S-A8]
MSWTHGPDPSRLRRAPVQQRSAERLGRILDACAGLLDEAGYEALSTRAVAGRADVPIGSVYRFFGNKRAMADALAQRNLDRYAERISERLATVGHDDWRTAVDAALDEYLTMKRTVPGFALVDFAGPVQAPSEANHLLADRLADLLAGHLERSLDAGLRRCLLVGVEAADAVLRLAFRLRPEGDPELIAETRELLHAYLARALD